MGRWAQRKRTGGSPSPPLNQLLSATITGAATAEATYANPLDGAGFTPGDFQSSPSNETGTSIANVSANVIEVTFSGAIAGDVDFDFLGSRDGFVSPNSVAYT